MNNFVEPYAKENNILQLSLFYFGKGKPKETMVSWGDDQGEYTLGCVSKYGVPGSFEQDVYTACMRMWVKQGMKNNYIKINYSEIARELHLSPPKNWVTRIKKALQKLGQARYEFNQCFFHISEDGVRKINTHFSLFDTATLFSHAKGKSKRNSESRLSFPDQIRDNLEAKYYQLLDMAWYRAIPGGLPRRLYEYLEKRRYHSKDGVFTIAELVLCRWLPIRDKHTTQRRRTLNKIAGSLIKGGYLDSYLFEKKKKQCIFKYAKKGPPPSLRIMDAVPKHFFEDEKIKLNIADKSALDYQEVFKWISGIKYFRKNYLKQIKELSKDSVLETFPHVRYMWNKGKINKPGGVYKAFMESWREKDLLIKEESRLIKEKHKTASIAKEAYEVVHQKFIAPVEKNKKNQILELEKVSRQKRREEEAKEKEERRLKKEIHKVEVITYIAKKGKENLFLLGGSVVNFDPDGVVIDKDGEERTVKYGNIFIGINLKGK